MTQFLFRLFYVLFQVKWLKNQNIVLLFQRVEKSSSWLLWSFDCLFVGYNILKITLNINQIVKGHFYVCYGTIWEGIKMFNDGSFFIQMSCLFWYSSLFNNLASKSTYIWRHLYLQIYYNLLSYMHYNFKPNKNIEANQK